MSSGLDPEARDLLRLALEVEQQLPRDPERVRRRLMASVATGAATALGANAAQAKVGLGTKLAIGGATGFKGLVVGSAIVVAAAAGYHAMTKTPERTQASLSSSPAEQQRAPAVLQQPKLAPQPREPEPRTAELDPSAPELEQAEPNRKQRLVKRNPPSDSNVAKAARPLQTDSPEPRRAVKSQTVEEAEAPEADEAEIEDETLDTPAAKADPLATDLRWLREAQKALNAGAPSQALTLVRKIRGTQLRSEQIAVEVFAYCALGDTAKAQRKAELFRSIAKGSPLLPRINASCAKP